MGVFNTYLPRYVASRKIHIEQKTSQHDSRHSFD